MNNHTVVPSLSILIVLLHLSPPSILLALPPTSLCLYMNKPQQVVLSLSLADSLQNNYTEYRLRHDIHTHTRQQETYV